MMRWSRWYPFPDPRNGELLHAPFGVGVYEVRRASTGKGVLFGISSHVAGRMVSLLPHPLGSGTRENAGKRAYCKRHLEDLKYRTRPCESREEAQQWERRLRKERGPWVYDT